MNSKGRVTQVQSLTPSGKIGRTENYNDFWLDNLIGEPAVDTCRIIRNGIIQDWDLAEDFLRTAIFGANYLNKQDHEFGAVSSLCAFCPIIQATKLTELYLEAFQTLDLILNYSTVLSCLGAGRTEAVSVDFGYEQTTLSIVGFPTTSGMTTKTIPIGGATLSALAQRLLTKCDGYETFKSTYPSHILQGMIDDMLRSRFTLKKIVPSPELPENFDLDDLEAWLSQPTTETTGNFSETYSFPDGTKMKIPAAISNLPIIFTEGWDGIQTGISGYSGLHKRFFKGCSREIFDEISIDLNTLVDLPNQPISRQIASLLDESGLSPQHKSKILKALVLSGGSSIIPELHSQLKFEDQKLQDESRIVALPARQNGTWIGGSVMGSMNSFDKYALTKSQYEEEGGLRFALRSCKLNSIHSNLIWECNSIQFYASLLTTLSSKCCNYSN